MTKAALALTTIFSLGLWAAPNTYFSAVLGSDALKKVMASSGTSQIKKIQNTMTYRCLGCFDFEVTLQTSGDLEFVFFTRLTHDGKIEVQLK